MSDSYTQFSELISDITPEEEKWIAGVPCWDGEGIDEDEEKLKAALVAHGLSLEDVSDVEGFPRFEHTTERGDWWIHSDDSCDLEHVACVVQGFIKKFRPEFVFQMTWATYESKPLIGAFGGGWCVVSKDDSAWGNVWSACDAAMKELEATP